MLRTFRSLRGFSLAAQTAEKKSYADMAGRKVAVPVKDGEVGKIREFYFDDASWTVRYLVVETGSWLAGRSVLILPKFLGSVDQKNQTIPVSLTRKQVEESPSIDTDKPVSRQHESDLLSYYGAMPYWQNPGGFAIYDPRLLTLPSAREAQRKKKKGDPHLRSSRDVTGYRIQAEDGDVGHVEDFVVDDQTWRVHYLMVGTRDWWPGKMVLVAPSWIKTINWRSGKVVICLPRAVLQEAPEYDTSLPISADYEQRLLDYYRRLGASPTRKQPPKRRSLSSKPTKPGVPNL